jgi:DNA-binding winged helix-turn-helix (wHTH) protein/tetratricopeptide (TPR) repeat protein
VALHHSVGTADELLFASECYTALTSPTRKRFSNLGIEDRNLPKLVYRFGHFEASPETGELYRRGHRVRIQELPFRVLMTLIEQRGEIVSREELAKQLWTDNTFVEFDQGLSTAVAKLRQAIGDDAANPRFVETIPRRGYRFIAPVTIESTEPAELTEPFEPSKHGLTPPLAPQSERGEPAALAVQATTGPRLRRLWQWTVAGALTILIAIAAFLFRSQLWPRAVLRTNDRVMLADFENATGNGAFDDTLMSAVRVKLDESPFFSLVSAKSVQAAISRPSRASSTPALHVSASDAQVICQTVHARAVVQGSVSPAQGGLRVRLEAKLCGGKTLAREDAFSPSMDLMLTTLGDITDRLRRDLGEPEDSLQRFSTPITMATTTSFSAFQAFAAGEKKRARGQDHETLADYKLATDLDPEFALAYARLGTIYGNENEVELSRAVYQKAFDLRSHATERERLYLTAHYYGSALGDVERAIEVYKLWRQLYPQDLIAPNNLADSYETVGQPELARLMALEAQRIDPNNAFPYAGLLQADQRLGRWDEVRAVWRDAEAKKLNNSVISRMAMFRVGVATGDDALIREQLNWASNNPREGELLMLQGWAKAAAGHLREAQTFFHQAQTIAVNNDLKEFAADVGEDLAQLEADFGKAKEARVEVGRSLELAPDALNVKAFAAMVLASAGDEKKASELEKAVRVAAPQNTIYNKMIVPITESRLSLTRSDAAIAVEQLRPVAAYDLSRVTELASIYYRAEALLAAQRGAEAEKEFERLRQLRAICPVSPYLALSELGIARSRRQAGNSQGALVAYSAFFEGWKDADVDIPILHQARAEFRSMTGDARRDMGR